MVKNKPAAQAAGQTLPDATPPVGAERYFGKSTVYQIGELLVS